uniref:Uncharacterized protein n=1 Tax=Romanomermis culicivorax TaxID=13658 RepID=A0A915K1G1_ROMCU
MSLNEDNNMNRIITENFDLLKFALACKNQPRSQMACREEMKTPCQQFFYTAKKCGRKKPNLDCFVIEEMFVRQTCTAWKFCWESARRGGMGVSAFAQERGFDIELTKFGEEFRHLGIRFDQVGQGIPTNTAKTVHIMELEISEINDPQKFLKKKEYDSRRLSPIPMIQSATGLLNWALL